MDLLRIFRDCWGWCWGNNTIQTLPSSPETTGEISNERIEIESESSPVVIISEETSKEEEVKLNSEIINQLRDFNTKNLTSDQEILIDKLIPDEKLKRRFKEYGLCEECQQPNTGKNWCRSCKARWFKERFSNWTSGNSEVDAFIQKSQLEAIDASKFLEWIPYEQFDNAERVAKGGYSTVYKANWKDKTVALKILDNSRGMSDKSKFFQEIVCHKLFNNDYVVKCYGISCEPETGDYVMVTEYIKDGNLRQFLTNNQLSFINRLNLLKNLAFGLELIHEQNLVHKDFHSGNILNVIRSEYCTDSYIADLGLSQPVNETNEGKIYGVLPYLAPEVLRERKYTKVSDIYSFGIVAYEIFSNSPPFHEYDHDTALAERICNGLRPQFKIELPQSLKDLIKSCWDAYSRKRPTASEIYATLRNWCREIRDKRETEFVQQYHQTIESLNPISLGEQESSLHDLSLSHARSYEINLPIYEELPQEFNTSRRLRFENLPEPRNDERISKQFYKSASQLGPEIVIEEVTNKEESNISVSRSEIIRKEEDQELIAQTQVPPKQGLK